MDIRHVCPILIENGIFRQIFVKIPSTRLQKQSVSWKSRCPIQTDEGTDTTTTVITFSKVFADA